MRQRMFRRSGHRFADKNMRRQKNPLRTRAQTPMKIARFSSFGRPDLVIECVDIAEPPAPQADEAALEVLAFPINPADLLTIEGMYAALPPLPATPGADSVARFVAA